MPERAYQIVEFGDSMWRIVMKSKMFEIRDSATCITVIAIKTESENEMERSFYERGGWGPNSIILINTNGGSKANHDPFKWREENNRILFEAHRYIEKNFDKLENYSVVDVQHLLGETTFSKNSDIWRK